MKFLSTLRIAATLVMARTFGQYINSVGGPNQPDYAVYRWRGKKWWIPINGY